MRETEAAFPQGTPSRSASHPFSVFPVSLFTQPLSEIEVKLTAKRPVLAAGHHVLCRLRRKEKAKGKRKNTASLLFFLLLFPFAFRAALPLL